MPINTGVNGGGVGRLYGLDLFRIALALLVWLFHSHVHIKCDYGMLNGFISVGALAMTGFFMLSGFAMWDVYSKSDFSTWTTIRRFYLKRIIALWPLMVVAGYLSVVPNILKGVWPFWKALLLLPIELLGLSTTFDSLFYVSHTGGTWFISCIFICYLIFPLLVLVAQQLTVKARMCWLFTLVMLVMLCPVVVRVFAVSSVYSNPFFRFYEFGVGMLLASLLPQMRNWILRWHLNSLMTASVIVIAHVVIISLFVQRMPYSEQFSYVLCSVVSLPFYAALLYVLALSEAPRFLESKIVLTMSAASFAFFLAQFFCFRIVSAFGCQGNCLKIVLSLLVCIVLSVALYKFVQQPSKKYLNQRFGL